MVSEFPEWSRAGLVVVAAGSGSRFGGWKQLAPLCGHPLLFHALAAFLTLPLADRVVVLPDSFLQDGQWQEMVSRHPDLGIYRAVAGGDERALSVRAGVEALTPGCHIAIVQDGARPFPPLDATLECIRVISAPPADIQPFTGAIVGGPVTDTIKRVGSGRRIVETVNRSELARAETPQVALREPLLEALRLPGAETARDEAEALERAGHRVAAIVHHGPNPKVTRSWDLPIAEAILQHLRSTTGAA